MTTQSVILLQSLLNELRDAEKDGNCPDFNIGPAINDWANQLETAITAAQAAGVGTAAGSNDTIDAQVLRDQLKEYAESDCRDCDGSGVFYANVCICGCVLAALTKQGKAAAVNDQPICQAWATAWLPVSGQPSDKAVAQAWQEECATYANCMLVITDAQFRVTRRAREIDAAAAQTATLAGAES